MEFLSVVQSWWAQRERQPFWWVGRSFLFLEILKNISLFWDPALFACFCCLTPPVNTAPRKYLLHDLSFFFTCIFVGQPMNLFNKQIYSCSTKYRRYHPKPGELILPSSGHLALFTYCCGRSTILVTLRCVKCDVHRDINDQSQLPLAGLDSQQRLDTSDRWMIGLLYQHGPQPSFMTQKNALWSWAANGEQGGSS